ncbi:histone-fold-containing protein [Xylona heveae TC161]|uniref:Histone-fold-containing protein n=1 Tax=Xylona heveae (strain CBS 132557 / TC161) TaxID=1328760 RepID=A0A165JEU2_XYLHT|nr:histone-fold-containing protein [Xylona heveae TC161]KZF26144.1 histone-fold-containing protein [Xylona heveae TC161]
MSASPNPKEVDVEPGAQSPDEAEHMERDPQEAHAQGLGYEFEVKEQDRWLPIANVARIMKLALPENAKIAKEAKECMQECVSEFISFITSEASEKCQQEKRKTVNGEDILFAMTSLGFENYAEALKIYLSKYRETQSARGENQNRPGYGAPGVPGEANSSASANYQGASDGANNILSPTSMEAPEHEAGPYGNVYQTVVGANHNGSGPDQY